MSRQLRNVLLGALILVFVTAGTAVAASVGSPFRLGVLNTINALTRLTGARAGPMLRITNNGTGTALQLIVKAGRPPLITNSTTKVVNLNADSIDGLDSSAFLPVGGKAADSNLLDGLDSSAFLPVGGKAADANLLDNLDSTRFMGATLNRREAAPAVGTDFGGGHRLIDQACNPGEVLLSGGPANIDNGTLMVESFPSSTGTWRVRVQNDGTLDSFSVVVLCASR